MLIMYILSHDGLCCCVNGALDHLRVGEARLVNSVG